MFVLCNLPLSCCRFYLAHSRRAFKLDGEDIGLEGSSSSHAQIVWVCVILFTWWEEERLGAKKVKCFVVFFSLVLDFYELIAFSDPYYVLWWILFSASFGRPLGFLGLRGIQTGRWFLESSLEFLWMNIGILSNDSDFYSLPSFSKFIYCV